MNASNDQQNPRWPSQLADGLAAMELELTPVQQGKLLDYLALLYKWNKVYNLTAVRDLDQAVSRQLLDSLSILPRIEGPRVLDVGCGAGLPGIPLAIARPDLSFTLIDANGKKTRFVQQAIGELGLAQVAVHQARVEALELPCFDQITSRAFASLADFVNLSGHLLCPKGHWLAMKGQADTEAPGSLPDTLRAEVQLLDVPGCAAARSLITVRQA